MRKSFLPELPSRDRLQALLPFTSPAARPPRQPAIRRRNTTGQLALSEIRSNLAITGNTITAWFTCGEQLWPFQSDARRETAIESNATQIAALAGRHLHLRRISIPFDTGQWARVMRADTRPLPDVPGAHTTWTEHLASTVKHINAGGYTIGRTMIGVQLNATLNRDGDLDEAGMQELVEITEIMSRPGLQGRTSTVAEMTTMLYRSVGIGLEPPSHHAGDVGPDDIAEFTEPVDWQRTSYSSTTKLTDRRTGRSVHVAVLTVGRMEALTIPQNHQPWAHLSEQAGYPVEWSSRVMVLGPDASRGSLNHRLLLIRSQQKDYADHQLDEPLHLERLAARATIVGDEIDTGLPVTATRVHGWHRLAVTGDTQQDCLARARDLTNLYAEELHTTLVHPRGQLALLREFIPGEPTARTGFIRRLPARMFACAMPQASARVGDDRGDLIGYTATSGERPVFLDPHFPMEVRARSGLSVMVSEPGGGKSTLMGALGYLNARRGVQVTLMDPSGPLARLCQLPELAPHSRVFNLTGSQPGTLAPYAMIPTPQRSEFQDGPDGDDEFVNAVATAQTERSWLVLDILQMLLPAQVVKKEQTITTLRRAVRRVAPEEGSTLDEVVQAIYDHSETGIEGNVADLLDDMTRLPMGRLFFGRPPAGTLSADAALTVITMAGLRLPDFAADRQYWSVEESLAVPMLHMAHRLAVRRCYSGDQHARKFVGLDEAHIVQGWESGRNFLRRLARDSRKWNLFALLASQDPADILKLDMQNLVTTTFVGRIAEDAEVAAEALRLLRVPTGVGYEETVAGLSQYSTASTVPLGYREVVMRDVDGRIQKVRIDLSHLPHLLDVLNTTPGGAR